MCTMAILMPKHVAGWGQDGCGCKGIKPAKLEVYVPPNVVAKHGEQTIRDLAQHLSASLSTESGRFLITSQNFVDTKAELKEIACDLAEKVHGYLGVTPSIQEV